MVIIRYIVTLEKLKAIDDRYFCICGYSGNHYYLLDHKLYSKKSIIDLVEDNIDKLFYKLKETAINKGLLQNNNVSYYIMKVYLV